MLILGIESSCDETAAALISAKSLFEKVDVLSDVVASSLQIHSKTGGIIPENAAREQVKFIIPVIDASLKNSSIKLSDIDAIAVTHGPGLIGSLLVGVETAKVLSYVFNKPLIPTNHLIGHIYANFAKQNEENEKIPRFPALGLIVSGGHTDLILIRKHGRIKWLGGTRDDAAGEALDKIGRLLKLPYPGGPYIERAAKLGKPNRFKFPSPLINSRDYDFSFSGLKTAVLREVTKTKLSNQIISDISYSVQKSIIDVLIKKTINASEKYKVKSILLGGGVAANNELRQQLQQRLGEIMPDVDLFVPSKKLCTDNAVMIASAAFYNRKDVDWRKLEANPSLYF